MTSDKVRDEIKKAFNSLETKLLKEGFKESEIEELKLDLEVGIKNKSSLTEILEILKDSQKKVIDRKKKSKNKESNKEIIDEMLGELNPSDNYDDSGNVEAIIRDNEEEIIEATRQEQQQMPGLEENVSANNAYFSQGGGPTQEKGVEYFHQGNESYDMGKLTTPKFDANAAMQDKARQDKEDTMYQMMGKKKKDRGYESTGAGSPSDVYR